jgi:hypothetical protein
VSSFVPPAVVALHDAWRRALPDPTAANGVEVYLGIDTNRPWAPRRLTVACSFDEDIEAFSVTRTETGARPNITEQIDVACSAYIGAAGPPDYEAWRTVGGDMLAAIDNAMLTDATFLALVARSRRTFTRWIDWSDSETGAAAVYLDLIVSITVFS